MMTGTTKLYSLDDLDFHSRSRVCTKIRNLGVHFLVNQGIDLDKIQYVATTCWFVEAHAKLFYFTQVIFN